jgi:transcriptional regulator with XRE-family HTH domain
MTNILANNEFVLDDFNPASIAKKIAGRMRERRLERKLTQKALASKAGISLGSLKRFELTHEISLKHLLKIALVLDATADFSVLFAKQHYQSIDELLKLSKTNKRERGSRNA